MVTQGVWKKNARIENRDDFVACLSRQSKLVVKTVVDGFARHPGNRIMAVETALLPKSNQVLQTDAPMSANPVERYSPLVKQAIEELAGETPRKPAASWVVISWAAEVSETALPSARSWTILRRVRTRCLAA